MDTKFQQAILDGIQDQSLNYNTYMSDDELYYLQNLNKNEGLIEYYH